MTQISDERLAELVTLADWMAAQTELGVTPEFSACLRELQQLRQAIVDHNKAMSGACQILHRDQWPPAS